MKIKTNSPILPDRVKTTRMIANFWNKISESWLKIWGPHIHHGYYENNEATTPLAAQEKLIEKLSTPLKITPQDSILDAGCGMGGSSLYLAGHYHAHVTGITLSDKQVAMANHVAQETKTHNVQFKIEDALSLKSFANDSFDLVWSLESCEQFYDKNLFLQQAFRVLKPGGQLMLATWCSGSEEYADQLAKKYQQLCTVLDLPYMPTIPHYCALLKKQGFQVQHHADWSEHVIKTWDLGLSLLNVHTFLQLFKMGGWQGLRFVKGAKMMREAFHEKRVLYGVFYAVKPPMSPPLS